MPTPAKPCRDRPGAPPLPASLILLFVVEAVVVLAVAAWMMFVIMTLSRLPPTSGEIAQLLLMLVGAPLAIVGLAMWAARTVWRRGRLSASVAVALLPLLLMLGALGVAITM